MLTQNDFSIIIQKDKFIEEPIIIGDFTKRNYKVLFYEEEFNTFNVFLDISQSGSIEIKHSINKRAKKAIPILRLDIKGANHTNPEFNEDFLPENIDKNILNLMKKYSKYKFKNENHLHYFIENYRDKWAFPPYELGIDVNQNFYDNIQNFCHNFNIKIQIKKEGLFWKI